MIYAGQDARSLPTSAPKPIEKPRLQQQLDQLEKVLSGCHECASRIENAADRLLNPKPQDVGKTAERPSPNSIEGRLAMMIEIAEGLGSRLIHAANQLDQTA